MNFRTNAKAIAAIRGGKKKKAFFDIGSKYVAKILTIGLK